MQDIALMYHYVREQDGWRGIQPLRPDDFEKQIDYLAKQYEIVSVNDLDKPTSKPKCVLTFDDGTRDQYTCAFPILKRKGVPAYFSIMSGPIVEHQIPIFHLLHVVLSHREDRDLWLDLPFDVSKIPEKTARTMIYDYEPSIVRRWIKYLFNFELSSEEVRTYLEGQFDDVIRDRKMFIDDFYLQSNDIVEMHRNGMTIGVHCHHHEPYKGDAELFYQSEIAPCVSYLNRLGIIPEWYTAPFGGGTGADEMLIGLTPLLQLSGFKGGFLTRKGKNDCLKKFWLNRYDCIDFYPIGE